MKQFFSLALVLAMGCGIAFAQQQPGSSTQPGNTPAVTSPATVPATQQEQQQQPDTPVPARPEAQSQPSSSPDPALSDQNAHPGENPKTPATNIGQAPATNETPAGKAAENPSGTPGSSAAQDQPLTRQIQQALAANPRFSDVQPVVSGNQVTLAGTIATEADRADVKQVVESVPGVGKVVDMLAIGTTSHQPPGGDTSGAAATLPQSDVANQPNPPAAGAPGSAQAVSPAARGCECPKGQNEGKYAGSDQPCACSGTPTHAGESLPGKPPR